MESFRLITIPHVTQTPFHNFGLLPCCFHRPGKVICLRGFQTVRSPVERIFLMGVTLMESYAERDKHAMERHFTQYYTSERHHTSVFFKGSSGRTTLGGSWILDTGSRNLEPGSWVQDRGWWIQNPETQTLFEHLFARTVHGNHPSNAFTSN